MRSTVVPPEVVVRSTRYGWAISPLFATAAATSAIWSGVAVVSNCPIDDSASWSGLIARSKLDFATQKAPAAPCR
ncbi:hypothetical protein [Streptomyces narbonensis]